MDLNHFWDAHLHGCFTGKNVQVGKKIAVKNILHETEETKSTTEELLFEMTT